MKIGVPREIKESEFRIAMTPAGVADLTSRGHTIYIEEDGGLGSGFTNNEFAAAGGQIVGKEELFNSSSLIIKVKEPLPDEYSYFRPGQSLFTFLHLAANRDTLQFLLEKKITALGYETVIINNTTPLLAPMSEIAGRMAPLVGSFYLQKHHGGSGTLPAGATGVLPARALILGAGTVGRNAARIASGLGMSTTVLNNSIDGLQLLDGHKLTNVQTAIINRQLLLEELTKADLVVGAVLIPGATAPRLVSRSDLNLMQKGSVIVDVSVDQGGCFETTRPTSHSDPIYNVDGITHYCVANMPGAYPRTATMALTNATLPYIIQLAELGVEPALAQSPALQSALNLQNGKIILEALQKL